MTAITKGMLFLAGEEAVVTSRYLDSKNVWTIGIGHTAAAGSPNPSTIDRTLTLSEIMDIFSADYDQYRKDVLKAVKVPLKQHQLDALVSWHYNTGAVSHATLTMVLNKGDYAGAAAEFDKWHRPAEIKDRRDREKLLFITGDYGDRPVVVYKANSAGKVLWNTGVKVVLNSANPTQPPAKPSLWQRLLALFTGAKK
jgi:lysozyme